MRVPVSAGLVLAAAATLAACASVTAPPATRPHASPAGPQPAAGIPGPPAGSRAGAAALAELMLSRLRLPPGARILPSVPLPPSLPEPAATTPISGSLSATATGTTIADGVLVTYAHGVWVSEGDKLFPFRSMGQLMADGFGGTPSVSVGTLAGLATVTAYAGS